MTRLAARLLALGLMAACAGPTLPGPAEPSGKPRPAAPSASVSGPSASLAPSTATEHPAPALPVSAEEVDPCGLEPTVLVDALATATAWTYPDVRCDPASDPFCDSVVDPPAPAETCFVADTNLARAALEIHSVMPQPTPMAAAWDGRTPPRWLDRVDAHLHLSRLEHEKLRDHGFVVLDRLPYRSYAAAFHDVFQEQLPLFVGIDPILHAVFRGTERALETVERRQLVPALTSLLRKLRAELTRSRQRYDPDTLADLDVYLGVAAELWGTEHLVSAPDAAAPAASLFGHDAEVNALASRAGGALEPVELFGRTRMVDFSQLEPRGHYAAWRPDADDLAPYFRALMWLERLELNLVSRSSRSSEPGDVPNPEETPREARMALALAELVERSGAASELARFDAVYTSFAGRREDLSPAELRRLAQTHGLAWNAPFERLKAAIGSGYGRTARVHYMPQGATDLPVILTLLGPRIVPDVAPLTRLVHDAVPERYHLGAADVAYLLGHDRARSYLAGDLARFPTLGPALDAARRELAGQVARSRDVYGSWLRGLLALGAAPTGVVPSFMKREAYADLRMGSALVGYGQLRHAFVLLAGQGYDAYGCEIPDAYLEPLPGVFDALSGHVKRLRATGPGWEGLARTLDTLGRIARHETSGAPLAEPERRWLAMVSEHLPRDTFGDSGEPPKWTGWYFDMFDDREYGATASPAFVADYFTLTNEGAVAYLGAEGPRLAVFVVDAGGEPRAMVGPVAKGYEAETSIDERLDDERAVGFAPKKAAWREDIAVAAAPEPALGLVAKVARCELAGGAQWRAALRSVRPAGEVELTLLDHHADAATATATLDVGPEWRVAAFALPPAGASTDTPGLLFARRPEPFEGLHLRVVELAKAGVGTGAYDYFTSPSVFAGKYEPRDATRRPTGMGSFGIGASAPADVVELGRPGDF